MKTKLAELETIARPIAPETKFAPCDPAQLTTVSQVLPLSPELIDWYTQAAPVRFTLPWTSYELTLYAPADLIVWQAGYRWSAIDGQRLEEWPNDWIVIGDVGSDPMIAHVNEPGTPVSVALHGIGVWEPRKIADSLSMYIDELIVWTRLLHQYDRIGLFDADLRLRPEVLRDMRTRVASIVAGDMLENLMWFLAL